MGISPKDFARLKTNVTKVDLYIGIDPGVHTGFAVWNPKLAALVRVESMMAVEAEVEILEYADDMKATGLTMHVVVEDTRNLKLPKKLQNAGRAKGAGSVHRDMSRWEEFLTYHNVPFTMGKIAPKSFRESDDAGFRKMTGWGRKSNEHGRCAAGMVYGR